MSGLLRTLAQILMSTSSAMSMAFRLHIILFLLFLDNINVQRLFFSSVGHWPIEYLSMEDVLIQYYNIYRHLSTDLEMLLLLRNECNLKVVGFSHYLINLADTLFLGSYQPSNIVTVVLIDF